MVRTAAVALALTLAAAPAVAQTTACGWEWGKWVCRTTQPQPDPSAHQFPDVSERFQRSYEMSARMRADQEDRETAQAQTQAAHRQQAEENRLKALEFVQRYVALGQCADAIRVAERELSSAEAFDVRERCR
jgi:hypothetical protein